MQVMRVGFCRFAAVLVVFAWRVAGAGAQECLGLDVECCEINESVWINVNLVQRKVQRERVLVEESVGAKSKKRHTSSNWGVLPMPVARIPGHDWSLQKEGQRDWITSEGKAALKSEHRVQREERAAALGSTNALASKQASVREIDDKSLRQVAAGFSSDVHDIHELIQRGMVPRGAVLLSVLKARSRARLLSHLVTDPPTAKTTQWQDLFGDEMDQTPLILEIVGGTVAGIVVFVFLWCCCCRRTEEAVDPRGEEETIAEQAEVWVFLPPGAKPSSKKHSKASS
jgi:hypothetical protein